MPCNLDVSPLWSGGREQEAQEEFPSKPLKHPVIIDVGDNRSTEIRKDSNQIPSQP